MGILTLQQNSFVGGEWSPFMYGRTDLEKYRFAVKTMKNFIAQPYGGIVNRPGTYFVGEALDQYARLIPFQYSITQSYVLEFTDQKMRVIKDGAFVIESSKTITSTLNTNPVRVTITSHGFSTGDYVFISGVSDMTEINNRLFQITYVDANTFSLDNEDGTSYSTGTGGTAEKHYVLTSPFSGSDLRALQYSQDADTMILTHQSYAPRELSRTGDASWTISTITYGAGISEPTSVTGSSGSDKVVVTATSTDGEESKPCSSVSGSATGSVSWSAPSTGDVEYYSIYKDKDDKTGVFGWQVDVDSSKTTWTDASVDPDISKTPPQEQTPFNASGDYPACVTRFQQRSIYAGSSNQPQTIWGSMSGFPKNFNTSIPSRESDPFEFTLDATQVNAIRWLVPMNKLIVGTMGSEWIVSGGSEDLISYNHILANIQSEWGCHDIHPLVVGHTILFVTYGGNTIRDMRFSYGDDSFVGNDITIFARHLFDDYTIVSWAYQRLPYSVVWCVRSDGVLLGITYLQEHNVYAWHQHETEGNYKDVVVVPDGNGGEDVYFVVSREINGNTNYYIEQQMDRLPSDEDVKDAFFVDSGLTYEAEKKAISNIDTYMLYIRITTSAAHGLSDGDYIYLCDLDGYSSLDERMFLVDVINSTSFYIETSPGQKVLGFSGTFVSGNYQKCVNTVSGFYHLEGEDVVALSQGNVETGLTISDGAVTLNNYTPYVHIGLGYTSDLESLDFVVSNATDSLFARCRGIVSVILHLDRTRALWIGPNEDRLVEVPFRTNEEYDTPIDLYTGFKDVPIPRGNIKESRVFIRNTDPVPCSVLSILPRIEVGDA